MRTSVTLNVYELPLGNLSCSMEALGNGEGLSLSCRWPGGFPRARLLWEGLAQGVSAEEELHVNVTAPAPLDQTNLTCVGSHPTGTRTCTVRPASPGLALSRRVSTDVRGFAVVTMACLVVASPPATVRWYKESRELGSEAIVSPKPGTSEVRIQDFLLANHTGNYSCRAGNALGVREQGLELTAPLLSDFLVVRLNGSAVRFSWAQRRSDVVTSFRLQSRGGDRASRADVWQTWAVVDMSKRQAILTGLKADRGYTFRVLPMVGLQEGVPSQSRSVNPAQSQTLSAGAIIGIVLGCVGGILLVALIIVFVIWLKGHRKQTRMSKRQGVNRAGIQSNTAVTRRTRERQPADLYQAGPVLKKSAHSNSHRQAQSTEDQDWQSTVYSVSQNVTPDGSGRHAKQDISPQTTLPSSVKLVNSNSHQSSEKPSKLTLQRRKATMV
ncbi:V-set and immunoglobulin domain-containing protein 10-like [Hypanus sabinus]|uniref:V-set and immunoglobulin domain-containing protein 10-like n=1 Tax=Hypanus sabinus TaxID=79690 RepID=UPI0028C3CBBD|nr:V-set and immunoglobulin domain-containing protein 10-like [Hypanus sabinus]